MAKESFLRGAIILAVASALSRIVGIVYMVVLPRIIYDDGMGLFQLVKPIHYFAAVLAISGIPTAVSKLVAEKAAKGWVEEVQRVFRIGLTMMVITGSLAAVTMIGGAPYFAETFAQDLGVKDVIAILGPACFFLALSAAFRGYFQGLQYMIPTAVSQVTDQVVRVVTTIILSIMLMPYGVERAVTGVAWGSLLGECSGWLVLIGFYVLQRKTLLQEIPHSNQAVSESYWLVFKRLAGLALPVVVATVLWPIMQLADTLLIPSRMQAAGFSADTIREGVGHLGMALTLSQFPNIVTVALATSLVPAISEAWSLGSKGLVARRSEEAVRIALLFGIPSFVGLYVLAEPISQMLFGYPEAGVPLRILALGTVTLGVIQSTTGVLQGLGEMMLPVRNLIAGVICKFIVNYVLTANPHIGVCGAAWGTTIGWFIIALLNTIAVFRRVGVVIHFSNTVLKPCTAALGLAVGLYYVHDTLLFFLSNTLSTLIAISGGMVFYFLLLMLWGTILQRDMALIPVVGSRLGRVLQEWGFLRK